MSTTAPMTERTVTSVLLSLWKKPESTMQQLLRDTLAPLPDVQEALTILQQRRCLIEKSPTEIRLVSTGLPCWRDILEHLAKSQNLRLARRTNVYFKTTSTNDLAWQAAVGNPEDTDGLLVIADEQTAGRGRRGNPWLAKPEQSLLFSLLLRNTSTNSSIGCGGEGGGDELTLLAGLATARALESLLPNTTLQIKWPNDILHNGKKLAGILVERRNGSAVIGIGVNIAQTTADFPDDLAPRATSLYQLTSQHHDRLRVLAPLLQLLNEYFTNTPPQDIWLADWKSRCPLLNQRITLRSNDQNITGQILDIDPLRGLLLRDDIGATHFLSAQTTTLSQS